jgi:CubicO group peptidase (beta-lactamase class C family)
MEEDTIFRIYSMTKPITSVALMTLYEHGLFQLDTPVSAFIPAFKHLEVFQAGDAAQYQTTPTGREMTMCDLLTHTAGFTYSFMHAHPVDALYRARGVEGSSSTGTLNTMVQQLAELPLVFSPGTRWSYSVATDVVGYLVEILSGTTLDAYLSARIFTPLGMRDTAFFVPPMSASRLAANYEYYQGGFRLLESPTNSRYLQSPTFLSGGGGLVSTASDYFQFLQMLRNKGALNGERILGRKTVEFMTRNHLPNNCDLSHMGQAVFSEMPFDGIGFGLGFSVVLDPVQAHILGSSGEYAWGGAASTAFWIDPVEDLSVIFLTQLMPSSSYPIRRALRVLVYQALIDS